MIKWLYFLPSVWRRAANSAVPSPKTLISSLVRAHTHAHTQKKRGGWGGGAAIYTLCQAFAVLLCSVPTNTTKEFRRGRGGGPPETASSFPFFIQCVPLLALVLDINYFSLRAICISYSLVLSQPMAIWHCKKVIGFLVGSIYFKLCQNCVNEEIEHSYTHLGNYKESVIVGLFANRQVYVDVSDTFELKENSSEFSEGH